MREILINASARLKSWNNAVDV